MISANETIVLIPTYNEAKNIGGMIDQIFAVDPNLSVMILDDASPDGTAAVVEAKQSKYPNLSLLKRTMDKGFARSYIDGFRQVQKNKRYNLLITMDADFSHEPKEIPYLIAAVNHGADVVVGSRYASGQAFPDIVWWRRVLSRVANKYVQFILRIPVTDCTSGYIALRTSLLPTLEVKRICTEGYGFLFGLKYELSQQGAKIAEHPVRWPDRHQGKSKMTVKRIHESALLPWRIRLRKGGITQRISTYAEAPLDKSEPITRN